MPGNGLKRGKLVRTLKIPVRYKKKWHLHYGPAAQEFCFFSLEEDNFYATFSMQIGDRVYHSNGTKQFDRAISHGFRNVDPQGVVYSEEANTWTFTLIIQKELL